MTESLFGLLLCIRSRNLLVSSCCLWMAGSNNIFADRSLRNLRTFAFFVKRFESIFVVVEVKILSSSFTHVRNITLPISVLISAAVPPLEIRSFIVVMIFVDLSAGILSSRASRSISRPKYVNLLTGNKIDLLYAICIFTLRNPISR